MNNKHNASHPLRTVIILALTFIVAYYIIVCLHEWGHGTTAYLFGYKHSPFDVQYGGCLLLHCDESVHYDNIINNGHGIQAALIGISGISVTWLLFLISAYVLSRPYGTHNLWLLATFYWSCVLNMMAIFGYLPLAAFSVEGDIGRFVHGLDISPWIVFIPGTCLTIAALYYLFRHIIIKMYAHVPIRTLGMQRVLLLLSLCIIFLMLYTHGYNPISDKGTNMISRVLAIISIFLIPVLFGVM